MSEAPMPAATCFDTLSPAVRAILAEEGLTAPTLPQEAAIPRILAGESVLLIAPTGAGKTEAALLPVLDRLAAVRPDQRRGIAALWITPLRALNRDMERRLGGWCAKLGLRVEVRHGDTPQSQRRKQALRPPDLLVTTPETLQAILPAKVMRRHLGAVRWVVVDEVHQLAKDRRGIQLTIGLERLREAAGDFQRIGLSATVGNPAEVAALFGGEKPLQVVQASPPKRMTFQVEWPKPTEDDHAVARELFISPEVASYLTLIRDVVEAHTSTLVFVNSRSNAELLGSRLPQVTEGVAVHHGSLPRNVREQAEAQLKAGKLKALVCTSTLELGIDIGDVDQVVQYQSPRQTASLLQRVGRAGHDLERTSKGTLIAVGADDVLESVAIIRRAQRTALEPPRIHVGALDVLGHQVVGVVQDEGGRCTLDRVAKVVRRSGAYRDLKDADLEEVAAYLEKLGHLRREGNQLVATRRTRDYYFRNLSMIQDERTYPVVDLTTMKPVGILGEEEVALRARKGYTFIVRGRTWRIQDMAHDGTIYVNPVEDPTARIPGWDGSIIPVHWEVAQDTSGLRASIADLLAAQPKDAVVERLAQDWPANRSAVRRVVDIVAEHVENGIPMPRPDNIVMEAFANFLVVHAPYGEIVNETLGDVVEELLARKGLVRFWWLDGQRLLYELTAPTKDLDLAALARDLFVHDEAAVEALLDAFMNDHFPLGPLMKGPAERLGAIPRGLMIPADDLASFEVRFKNTPVEKEALREALLEHMDLDRVRDLFRGVHGGRIQVLVHQADRASPLGHPIVRRYVEMPELLSPEGDRELSVQRLRAFLATERVNLLCYSCQALQRDRRIGDLPERPACEACKAPILGVLSWHGTPVQEALRAHLAGEELPEEAQKELARTRQGADLVAVHGKKAVLALAVYGVGPQAAARILAKMHRNEDDFYRDLYDAKLRYVMTRGFWDRERGGGPQRGREPVGRPWAYSPRDGPSPDRRL